MDACSAGVARYTELLRNAGYRDLLWPRISPAGTFTLYVTRAETAGRPPPICSGPNRYKLPGALPFLPAYSRYGHTPEQFPNAFAHQSKILSLPIFPELSDKQTDRVVDLVAEFAEETVNE